MFKNVLKRDNCSTTRWELSGTMWCWSFHIRRCYLIFSASSANSALRFLPHFRLPFLCQAHPHDLGRSSQPFFSSPVHLTANSAAAPSALTVLCQVGTGDTAGCRVTSPRHISSSSHPVCLRHCLSPQGSFLPRVCFMDTSVGANKPVSR